MENIAYLNVAAASPETRPADIEYNTQKILEMTHELHRNGVEVAVFPELCVTGYSCADLFGQQSLLEEALSALDNIARDTASIGIALIVGVPLLHDNKLFNCAAVIYNGKVQGVVPKSFVPNYGEFYERRWFAAASESMTPEFTRISNGNQDASYPFGTELLFEMHGVRFGIEICEDLWVPEPPSGRLSKAGADVIFNLSATNELIGKHAYLLDLIRNQSARCRCAYVYASAGTGESSTDLAFAGNCIIACDGTILAESPRFELSSKSAQAVIDIQPLRHERVHFSTYSDSRCDDLPVHTRVINLCADAGFSAEQYISLLPVDPHPFVDSDSARRKNRCEEISSIQAWGLAVRLRAINCRNAVVGISGGLDSTLALLVTVKAFDMLGLDRKGITGITMPGMGTTDRTRSNASRLMELLGVTEREIPINDAVALHFAAIGHDPAIHDVTYENSQARERTQILMDVANQVNGIVIGTGDLSELALGWCTYNGDQMSMYGVNASIPKTLVKYLVEGYANRTDNLKLRNVLLDIIDTPISPELLPPAADDSIAQKTEDLVGPYELHDFFLYHMLRHGRRPRIIYSMALKAFEGTYSADTIKHWLKTFYRRFFTQQFKRSCMPDGVKVGSVCLSPRGDWRMPSDASARLWLREVDNIQNN